MCIFYIVFKITRLKSRRSSRAPSVQSIAKALSNTNFEYEDGDCQTTSFGGLQNHFKG